MRIGFNLFGQRRRAPIRTVPPRPSTAAPTPPPRSGADILSSGQSAQELRQQALREGFTPTRPQRSLRRIAGRKGELLRIFQAIARERAHVVVYGERGRGKTSLVNLVAAAARSSGYMVGRYACSVETDFDEIMRGLARDLPPSLLAVPVVEDAALEGCEAALPRGKLQPRDLAALPGRLSGGQLLLIVDEFDRVVDQSTRTRFADTIKQVSDRGAPINFVIVGVSDSLEELLGRHPSIQRNVVSVPLPLLSDAEIQEILDIGSRGADLIFPPHVRSAIVALARGVPYIAQLLGLHAGDRALARGAGEVDEADLIASIQQATAEIDPRVAIIYEQLTRGGRDGAVRDALYLAAAGEQDRFARFTVSEEPDAVYVAGHPVHHDVWHKLVQSGAVRACTSAGYGVYMFAEPMLPHYILLRSVIERPEDAESTARTSAVA